jgi:predicted membrane-bound mannosyltransferase
MSKSRLWLFFIILIALALRLAWLGEQSLWYDEGVTWLLARMSPLS